MSFFENNRLVELVKGYIETKIELIKLDFKETIEGLFNRIFSFLLIAGLLIIGILLVLFGISEILNKILESDYLGYLITGLFSIIVSIILMNKQKKNL